MGFKVTATDLSQDGIHQLNEQARKKNLEGNITTLVCDMLDLPFNNDQFDCVLAFNSIYHTDYRGLKGIISKITNFLRDSGGLYITFNSKSNQSYRDPANERIDEYTIIKTQGVEKGIPHTHLEYKDVIDLLSDYKIVKIQHIQDFNHRGDSYHYFVEAEKK
jgi:ubiquinone/menaquinone biosynthesis C-methylase UbiE